MNNKEFTFAQVMKKMDIFEKNFVENPADKSLLDFFGILGKLIEADGYTTEQLQEIRDRIYKLREIFSETKKSLSKKSNEALVRHKNFSQYIKTSHIKNNN